MNALLIDLPSSPWCVLGPGKATRAGRGMHMFRLRLLHEAVFTVFFLVFSTSWKCFVATSEYDGRRNRRQTEGCDVGWRQ